MGAANVLVSLGPDGALLVPETGEAIAMPAAEGGPVKNTVGAGDSMVAGFLVGYGESGDCRKALALGTAAGAATAFSEGLATSDEMMRIYGDLIKE